MKLDHHPSEDMLLAHAAARLPVGPAIVVNSHLEQCARCRARLRFNEAVAGQLLDDLPAADLPSDALARTLAQIDAPEPAATPSATVDRPHPALPRGMRWPAALRGLRVSRWRWINPGMHFSRVKVPGDSNANVFLLRLQAGRALPLHTHSQYEVTQVLYGRFDDGRDVFEAGSFDSADEQVSHRPVVRDGECICLIAVEGKLKFNDLVANAFGAMFGV